MVKQHVARQYRDGPDGNTAIVSSGLNDDQDTLVQYGIAIADLEDGIGDVGGGNTDFLVTVGTTAERAAYAPDYRRVHLNTDTHIPEFGWGTEWRKADGTVVSASSGSGTSNAPTGMTATTNADNSISLSWTAPVGVTVTSYKLYELRSPTGVSGATALSGTSTTRTPGGTGTYEWWVTALVSGVESAPSNHASCSLPYTSTTTGGGATGGGAIDTPSEILRLGNEGGHWSLDYAQPSGNTVVDMPAVEDGWSKYAYLTPVESNTGVQFWVPMNGGTTSGSNYPRTELRERTASGAKAAWNANTGTHSLAGTTKATHFPPNKQQVVIAQIHDDQQDLFQLRIHNTQVFLSIKGTVQASPVLSGLTVGTYLSWSIVMSGSVLTCRLNGSSVYSQSHSFGANCYFKVGNYSQTNVAQGNSASEYLSTVMQLNSLTLSHS